VEERTYTSQKPEAKVYGLLGVPAWHSRKVGVVVAVSSTVVMLYLVQVSTPPKNVASNRRRENAV